MPPRKTASQKIPVNPPTFATSASDRDNVRNVYSKRQGKGVGVNIQRATEQRLIDSKILRSTEDKKRGMPHVIAWSAFLGFIAGGLILVYFLSGKNQAEKDSIPQITVPKATSEEMTSPPPPAPEAPPPPVEIVVQRVEILDTPTGFLNVRSGPGTNNPKIGEVKPGDEFDLVGTDTAKGWYEIRLTATSTGWVTNKYAKIINNQ